MSKPIPNDGLFPEADNPAEASLDDLTASAWNRGNHRSFRKDGEDEGPPGLEILREYFAQGFLDRFESVEAAERE